MANPASAADPELPNLRPDVVAGYRNAPPHLVAEVLDGELVTMPRPRPGMRAAPGGCSAAWPLSTTTTGSPAAG